jgi:hypothetical protein
MWELMLLGLGMFQHHHLMHRLQTKGMMWLLILLCKQNKQSARWKLIRSMLLVLLPRQGGKVISATKGGSLNAYHLYGMAKGLRFGSISYKASMNK